MELNEAMHRIVVGHWRLLLVFVLLPALVIAGLQMRGRPGYAATARVQASNQTPSTTTEADAVLNRAQGIATSPSVVQRALDQAKITDRSPAQTIKETSLSRVGTSTVLNVTVTDPDPRTAVALDSTLSTQLVTYLNGGPATASDASLIAQLTAQENALLGQRSQVAAQLALARTAADSSRYSTQLAAIDQQLGAVQAELNGLNNSSASVISQPADAHAASSSLAMNVGLGALLGLVAGLLVASVMESVRPRVADAEAFGREIGAPLLGSLTLSDGGRHGEDRLVLTPETLVGARRAVAHSRVDTLVLTGPDGACRLPRLAVELERLLSDAAAAGTARPASLNGDGSGASHPVGPRTPGEWGGGTGAGKLGAPRLLEAPELSADRNVRVRTLSELDGAADRSEDRREGLLVVVPDLAPHSEVRRVQQLATVTGWPLVGVLGLARDRRGRGKR